MNWKFNYDYEFDIMRIYSEEKKSYTEECEVYPNSVAWYDKDSKRTRKVTGLEIHYFSEIGIDGIKYIFKFFDLTEMFNYVVNYSWRVDSEMTLIDTKGKSIKEIQKMLSNNLHDLEFEY